MNSFVLTKTDDQKYKRLLVCMTFESFVLYLHEIESTPILMSYTGNLLIDQLLVTGNGNNRFVCCCVNDGVIDISSTKVVSPDNSIKLISSCLLNRYYDCIENSILTDYQKQAIYDGLVI